MKKNWLNDLSRRERQIIEIVYLNNSASVGYVVSQMTDAPSYSAVRTFMRILEDKGHLKHKKVGAKYIYSPTRARNNTRKSALKTVFQTFFDSSVENTVAALLDISDSKLSDEDFEKLSLLIKKSKNKEINHE